MQNELPIIFERNLYRAVIRYKQEHPGALEARTEQRREKRDDRQNPRPDCILPSA